MKLTGWTSCLVAAMGPFCFSQSLRPNLDAQAIVGAKIQVKPGVAIEKGTILMKNGMIVAVGENVVVPPGAQVLDGKGLTVYAGFIDAGSYRGAPATEVAKPRQYPTTEIDQNVVTQMRQGVDGLKPLDPTLAYDPDSADWASYRGEGITNALQLGTGGIIKGEGALVNTSGMTFREACLDCTHFISVGFRSGRGFGRSGGYPGTELGNVATFRQALLDANWVAGNDGKGRTWSDPFLDQLSDKGLNGRVFAFDVDEIAPTESALRLTKEIYGEKMKPVLVGVSEGYKNITLVKNAPASYVLSVNFGTEPMGQPRRGFGGGNFGGGRRGGGGGVPGGAPVGAPAGQTPATGQPGQGQPGQGQGRRGQGQRGQGQGQPGQNPAGTPGGTVDPAAAAAEAAAQQPLPVRQENQRQWLKKVKNAQMFEAAGIQFAFSSKGLTNMGDFLANIRRAIKEGLGADTALAALTTNAAMILHCEDRLGTIEAGKIANLTVLSGPFSETTSTVKFVFIDGVKFDPNKRKAAAAPARFNFGEDDDHE